TLYRIACPGPSYTSDFMKRLSQSTLFRNAVRQTSFIRRTELTQQAGFIGRSARESANSNAQWLKRLDHKDEQIDNLHAQVNNLNAVLRQSLEEKINLMEEKVNLMVENIQLKSELKAANYRLLGLLGKRNLRGAVEFIAASHLTKPSNQWAGVQVKLNDLLRDKAFKVMLKNIGQAQNLRELDMKGCFTNIYHTLSKDMHGSLPDLVICSTDFSPSEVAILVALFEMFSIQYEMRDGLGNVITYETQPRRVLD
ncbi:hypothetical protein Vafri_20211, partial [Volvox africanus]